MAETCPQLCSNKESDGEVQTFHLSSPWLFATYSSGSCPESIW